METLIVSSSSARSDNNRRQKCNSANGSLHLTLNQNDNLVNGTLSDQNVAPLPRRAPITSPDLKKLINFSIRTACERAAVGEEPRCALCKFDIVDGCCDDGACEGGPRWFGFWPYASWKLFFFFLNAETLRFGFWNWRSLYLVKKNPFYGRVHIFCKIVAFHSLNWRNKRKWQSARKWQHFSHCQEHDGIF